jgi:hypothetical protein
MIEEIKYSNTLSIWKTKFNFKNRNEVVNLCEKCIEAQPHVTTGGYEYYYNTIIQSGKFNEVINNELDEIRNFGINNCIDLFDGSYNRIFADLWVNEVKAINPVQINRDKNGELIFHKHTEINKLIGRPEPHYTFVVYIQMPNNLTGDDGVLYLEDIDGKVYSYMPENGDCIIMDGDLPHVPNYAPNSTVDRIVLGGNVKLDTIKTEKTLL